MYQCEVSITQASSIPCKQIFLSSKLTCTDKRNKLGPATLEALQILKFAYKQGLLDFTPDLIAHEKDYGISGPVSERAFDELVANEAYSELDELFANETDEL